MDAIDPAALSTLPAAIGVDRFATFTAASVGQDAQAIRLYAWNVEASASLWGGFHLLEVIMQNSIHGRLTHYFGREDWWFAARLTSGDMTTLERAVYDLDRTKGASWGTGHLIAELNFGFWVGLLANRYHAELWEPAICKAFPHFGGRRGEVHAALERLRKLRNRVAHHEPIFSRDLGLDHQQILAILRYINPEVALFNQSHSRLPAVLAGRPGTIAGTRPSRF